MLRHAIRGDQVQKWSINRSDERIIWTHDQSGVLRELPPDTMRWLSPWRTQLEARADARGARRWWSLFRTDGADATLPRVVWADIGKEPKAVVLLEGDDSVPLNTCYVIRCRDLEDAYTLAAIINSSLATAWLALVAEPARGGYLRYMGWTMSILPVPSDWIRARKILAPIGEQATAGNPPHPDDLLEFVLDSYRLHRRDVHELLSWTS